MEKIRKVYVVHKTHLDVGFTDLAQNVLEQYVETYIPKAIDTAYACNKNGQKKFVWTVGSYLIYYYLEHASGAGKARLEQAIRDGYIVWHALPCTTHTELMDAALFQYGLDIGKKLEARFGVHHIAAKMTDVPCHTAAMLPYLSAYGIQYLHIGINGSSKPIDVPELSLWRYGNHEIVLNYSWYYGRPCVFGDIALEFAHTADNMGPPTTQSVEAEMARFAQTYPDAEIVSAGLDEFAAEVLKRRDTLPVFELEPGDTWIHGAATDPWKSAMLRELLRIGAKWRAQDGGVCSAPSYQSFMENLLLISEHTCGIDFKKHLYDFKNWDKTDFQVARTADVTTKEELLPAGALIGDFIVQREFADYTGGKFTGSYSKAERSWEEQRAYARAAIACLPEALRAEAAAASAALLPTLPTVRGERMDARTAEAHGYRVTIQDDGSLRVLEKNGKAYQNTVLGILRYQTYGYATTQKCYRQYNRAFAATQCWAEPDFAKPGMQHAKTARDAAYPFTVKGCYRADDVLYVQLEASEMAAEVYGCPRCAVIRYALGVDAIEVHLEWFGKDANRLPEAIFFGFRFDCNDALRLYKLEQPVDPYRIIAGGNHKLHACQKAESAGYTLVNHHSPLVSVGGQYLYEAEDAYGDIQNGLHYLLYNNRWNTNFPLYYEDNAAFDFTLTLHEEGAAR